MTMSCPGARKVLKGGGTDLCGGAADVRLLQLLRYVLIFLGRSNRGGGVTDGRPGNSPAGLTACRNNHAWADAALKAQLRPGWSGGPEAALCSRLVYGVVQNQQLLDFLPQRVLLPEAGSSSAAAAGNPASGCISDPVFGSGAGQRRGEHLRGAGEDLRQRAGIRPCERGAPQGFAQNKTALPPIPERDEAKYLSIRYSHPKWLVKRLLAILGREETEAFLAANNDAAAFDGTGQPAENRRGKPDKGTGRLGRAAVPHPWVPGCLELTGAGRSDHAGTLPERETAGARPRRPAGVPDRRRAAGAKGAGSLRRPRRQVLQRRLCHGGQGGSSPATSMKTS